MKKLVILILIILVIWSCPIWASPDYDFNVKVMVNDSYPDFSGQPPFIFQNRIYVPLRIFADIMNADLVRHEANQQIAILRLKDGDVLIIKIGTPEYTWKGQIRILDSPCIMINNTVMLPVEIFSEIQLAKISWKGENRTVYVKWESPGWTDNALPNVIPAMRVSQFWTDRIKNADVLLLTERQISAYNQKILTSLPQILFDLADYPASLTKDQLYKIVNQYSFPTEPIFINGKAAETSYYGRLYCNMNVNDMEALNPIQYAFTVARTNVRSFPSHDVITSKADELDTDLLQETALGPAEPLLILHWSKDRKWCFIQSRNYAGWLESTTIAFSDSKNTWLEYFKAPHFLVITGSKVSPSFMPDAPDITKMQFTMGTKLPLIKYHETSLGLTGQSGAGAYSVIVPRRGDEGSLTFQHIRIPLLADVHIGYLPYTRRNIIQQAFKLQELRYGWGGMYESWDCSSLVMDVYRCFGIDLPRNTGQQAAIPGRTIDFTGATEKERLKLLENLSPGDVLYFPGHTMIYLGRSEGRDYVLSAVGRVIMSESEKLRETQEKNINGVVVSDLSLLRRSTGLSWLESITRAKEYR